MNSIPNRLSENAQEKAYQAIKNDILRFQLKPNQHLVAAELALQLGISRTPVREALTRLEHEGLVTRASSGGWGYRVKPMTLADVTDIFKVREVLEVESTCEASQNINTSTLEELRRILEEARRAAEAGHLARLVTLTRTFHQEIAKETHNKLLQSMLATINDRVQLIGSMTVYKRTERIHEILKENFQILDALSEGDLVSIEKAVRSHIQRSRDYVFEILQRDGSRLTLVESV